MENSVNIKRKHARFPAFDDETGVKIQREGRVRMFSNTEPLIISPQYTDTDDSSSEEDQRSLRRHTRIANKKAGHTPEQQRELEKHRSNLPDYGKAYHRVAKTSPTGRRNLFGETKGRTSYIVRKKEITPHIDHDIPYVDKQIFDSEEDAISQTSVGIPSRPQKKRFVPSYVPASVIPDKDENAISQEEILAAVKKDANSYLLFDTEPTAYQVKEREEEPSVQKFHGAEKSHVKMTRGEYKKMGKKKGLFEPKDSSKKTILERSLSGLIEEDSSDLDNNGYFPK